MSIYTRLIGIDLPRVPVHVFYALAHEVQRGEITGNAAGNFLGLSASEKQEANAIIARVTGGFMTAEAVHQVLMIAEQRFGLYDQESTLKARLGIS